MSTAVVTALRASGRQAGIVQRKRRKAHVASIAPQAPAWAAICDRLIPAAGAEFYGPDAAAETVDELDLCADCYRLVLLATLLVERRTAQPLDTFGAALCAR